MPRRPEVYQVIHCGEGDCRSVWNNLDIARGDRGFPLGAGESAGPWSGGYAAGVAYGMGDGGGSGWAWGESALDRGALPMYY